MEKPKTSFTSLKYPIPFSLCPNCSSIPMIHIVESDTPSLVQLKCHCTNPPSERIMTIKNYLSLFHSNLNNNQEQIKCQNEIDNEDDTTSICNNEAYRYCIQCNKWLCQSCLEEHDEFEEVVNNHITTPTKININLVCEKHNRDNDYFCKECFVPYCIECKKQDNLHQDHKAAKVNIIKKYGENSKVSNRRKIKNKYDYYDRSIDPESKEIFDNKKHYYCYSCHVTLTYEEKVNHLKEHKIVDLLEQTRNIYNDLQYTFKVTKKYFNEYFKRIKKELILRMQEEIVNINKAYKKNKELNRNIIHLINKIFSTYSLFAKKGKFSYQLMNNLIYNTRVNLPVATKVEASSNIGYQKINDLIEFYNNNYIFGRKEIKNENIYKVKDFEIDSPIQSLSVLHNGMICVGQEQCIKIFDNEMNLVTKKNLTKLNCIEEIENNKLIYYSSDEKSKGSFHIWTIPSKGKPIENEIEIIPNDEIDVSTNKIIKYDKDSFITCADEKIKYWKIKSFENIIESIELDHIDKITSLITLEQLKSTFVICTKSEISFCNSIGEKIETTIKEECNCIVSIEEKNVLVLGKVNGEIVFIDIKEKKKIENVQVKIEVKIQSMLKLRDNNVMIGTNKGLYHLNTNDYTVKPLYEVEKDEDIKMIKRWGRRCFIIVNNGGKISVFNY